MKKAVNLVLLAVFVLAAGLVYTQPAKEVSLYSESDINTAIIFSDTNKSAADTDSLATATTAIDEGKLPLFTSKQATDSNRLRPAADTLATSLSLGTSLIGIIVLALAISWFIQKKTGIASSSFGKILGIIPLDNKRLLYIVDVMGKMLVLGVTESNISFLTEITDKDQLDAYRLKYGQSVTPGLDKLFPFLRKKEEVADENTTLQHSEDKEKIEAEKNIAEVKSTLDKNHEKRLSRLKDMLIKQ